MTKNLTPIELEEIRQAQSKRISNRPSESFRDVQTLKSRIDIIVAGLDQAINQIKSNNENIRHSS
jgi:hypothetical protein